MASRAPARPALAGALVLLAAGTTACTPPWEHPGGDPVDTVRALVRAVRRDQCERAWTYFSKATQSAITQESERAIQHAPHQAELFSPKNLYCKSTYANRYESLLPRTAALSTLSGDTAAVSIAFASGSRLALIPFLSEPYRETPVTVHLLREDGWWKIDRDRDDVAALARAKLLTERQAMIEARQAEARAAATSHEAPLPDGAGRELPAALSAITDLPAPPSADLSGNLLANGGFEGLSPWNEFHQSNVQDLHDVTVTGGAVAWQRARSGADGGSVGVFQDVDLAVASLRGLVLCLDVRVELQSLGNTGWWTETHGGTGEMPARVALEFDDASGRRHEWAHGFLLRNEPPTRLRNFDLVAPGEWRRFCFDLLDDAVRRDARGLEALPRPVRLRRVVVGGNGWDFRGAAANVVLRGAT